MIQYNTILPLLESYLDLHGINDDIDTGLLSSSFYGIKSTSQQLGGEAVYNTLVLDLNYDMTSESNTSAEKDVELTVPEITENDEIVDQVGDPVINPATGIYYPIVFLLLSLIVSVVTLKNINNYKKF